MSSSSSSKEKTRLSENWTNNLGLSNLDGKNVRSDSWWTGKLPIQGECPGVNELGVLHSLNMPNLATCTRAEVQDYFDNGWTLTEVLFSSLIGEEAFYRPPVHGLRHPLVFYYLHPAVLYINKLRLAKLIDKPINSFFESLFAVGVDEMNWDDMSKNAIVWPPLEQLLAYRRQAYLQISDLISKTAALDFDHASITMDNPLWALFMGFEHERIHIETSSVLIRELPINLVRPPKQFPALHLSIGEDEISSQSFLNRSNSLHNSVSIPCATVTIGKPCDTALYGWDNEFGCRTIDVDEFSCSPFLVSNSDYYQFVIDGGYQSNRFWSDEAWRWRHSRKIIHPTFWVQDGPNNSNQYKLRTIFELISMQWNWPVIVNYHEAKAYCRWLTEKRNDGKIYTLPSEAQFHSMRQFCGLTPDMVLPPSNSNINILHETEGSVYGTACNTTPIKDIIGNVWQWSEDHFNPLPGFQPHPLYEDFSTPCFDGKHQMIFGGSFISTGDLASPWARYAFRPHFYQHAGFRIVNQS